MGEIHMLKRRVVLTVRVVFASTAGHGSVRLTYVTSRYLNVTYLPKLPFAHSAQHTDRVLKLGLAHLSH
jgi:hypothetical protein